MGGPVDELRPGAAPLHGERIAALAVVVPVRVAVIAVDLPPCVLGSSQEFGHRHSLLASAFLLNGASTLHLGDFQVRDVDKPTTVRNVPAAAEAHGPQMPGGPPGYGVGGAGVVLTGLGHLRPDRPGARTIVTGHCHPPRRPHTLRSSATSTEACLTLRRRRLVLVAASGVGGGLLRARRPGPPAPR